jgi:transcriptional regulator with XRE-family HTH domain
MTDAVGTALLRRYIGRRFAALRTAAGLTQEQAAEAFQRSRAMIARIEAGDERVRFREVDVRLLLDIYKASPEDAKVLLELTAETRNGRRKSWWHDRTDTELPEFFELYVLLEDSAVAIRQYEAELIPGLLQTRGYAELISEVTIGYFSEDERQRLVNTRMKRQALLSRPNPPSLEVIINESALRRLDVSNEVAREQLRHLLEDRPHVNVRVLPFSAGIHGGMATCGSFSILDFPADPYTGAPIEPPLAYVDTLTAAFYMNKPDEVRGYQHMWRDLDRRALDRPTSREFISDILKGRSSCPTT